MNDDVLSNDLVSEIAESYLERLRCGELPTLQEYLTQHPELSDELKELFETLHLVEGVGQRAGAMSGTSSRAAVFAKNACSR